VNRIIHYLMKMERHLGKKRVPLPCNSTNENCFKLKRCKIIASELNINNDQPMTILPVTIEKALSKAYLKQDINQLQIDLFKQNLKRLFERTNEAEIKQEFEEHFKTIVSDFLKETY